MRQHKAQKIIVLVLLLLIALPDPSKAGIPSDQVRQTADKVLLILQDPRLKAADKKKERRNQLRQVISARFDFSEMAKRSLGQHWQRGSAEEQGQFVQLFTDLLERSYANQIESFNGEKIVYGRESQDRDHAEVDTRVITNKGEGFSVNYKLYSAGREWKVYDVVIENISLVNNYRSQFNRVLTNSSFAEFLRKLQEKNFDATGKPERRTNGARS
ncbi:MAG: ABC transporter substrate-binding protein [Deltaproteobacteria bacterium]|nr:ABC transporter substrate-binding protein [Deltaproteobacteria bacterium]MBI2533738.1 ABC transporter substrate-binding protein [Deltaproteobacteria bacterium]